MIEQDMLEQLSCGLLLLDDQGKIAWANGALGKMVGMKTTEIVGKAPEELPVATRQMIDAGPQLVPATGDGHWVQREQVSDDLGRRLMMLIDVSAQEQLAEENARLRQQVEDLKLTDDLTGLPNKRAISQALDLHVSRSRRYQNPLSAVLVHVDISTKEGVQPFSTDPILLAVSRFLRDRLRWVDQIARWEDNIFLLVLPETDEADAFGLLDKIAKEQESIAIPDSAGDLRAGLTFGLACWKKGDDMRVLLRRAVRQLQQALEG